MGKGYVVSYYDEVFPTVIMSEKAYAKALTIEIDHAEPWLDISEAIKAFPWLRVIE